MKPRGSPQLVSFVIHLWLEPRADGPEWRGHVRSVQEQAEAYFRDLPTLLAFLGNYSGVQVECALHAPDNRVPNAEGT
jgi:hypothetical protein